MHFAVSTAVGMAPKAAKEAKTKAAPAKSPDKTKPDAAKSSGDKKEKSDRNGKKEKTKKAPPPAAGKQAEMDLSSKPEPVKVDPAVDPNASFLDKLAAAESKPPLGKPEVRRSASKAALGPQPFPARSSSNSALKPKGPKAPA